MARLDRQGYIENVFFCVDVHSRARRQDPPARASRTVGGRMLLADDDPERRALLAS